MELGRRAYNRRRYEYIDRPRTWRNKEYLINGSDVQVLLDKIEDGARLYVRRFVFEWMKPILFYISEAEYNYLRLPDSPKNSAYVTIMSNTRKLLRQLSFFSYKIRTRLINHSFLRVQKVVIDDTMKARDLIESLTSDKVKELALVVVTLINADYLLPSFFRKHWQNGYNVTNKLVSELKALIRNITTSNKFYVDEILAVCGYITNYCLLRKGHFAITSTSDGTRRVKNDIREYLISITDVEEARLVAKLVDDVVTHHKYKDFILTLFDKQNSRRVQIVIDNRYRDLVSLYTKKGNTYYYRVGTLEDLGNIINMKGKHKDVMKVDDGIIVKYGYIDDTGRTYTNFNYLEPQDSDEILDRTQEIIEKFGIKSICKYQLTTRCFFIREELYVSFGIGPVLSRYGHEEELGLEKKIGSKVIVRPNEIQTKRFGILPYVFYAVSIFLLVVTAANVRLNTLSLTNFDRIGIIFAVWSLIVWFFTQFTHTVGGIKDLMSFKARFTKVSQVRGHFFVGRRDACRAFYMSKFLSSLVGKGYKCYMDPNETNGPLEMDEIARFEEVIGRRSMSMNTQILTHSNSGLSQIRMSTKHGVAHVNLYERKESNDSVELFIEEKNITPTQKVLNSITNEAQRVGNLRRIDEIGFGQSSNIDTLLQTKRVLFDSFRDEGALRTNFFIGYS